MENFSELLKELAMLLVMILAPVIAAFVLELLRRYVGIEKLNRIQLELETKQEFVNVAVLLMQQFYTQMGGGDKFDLAKEWTVARLKERGINWTDKELRGLIEASVKQLKYAFGDEWKGIEVKDTKDR